MKNEILMTGPMYAPTATDLEQAYTVHKLWAAADREVLLGEIGERVTAVASSGGINAATIARLPRLKVIAHFGVGYDSVDVQAARARGIAVTNTPDVLTEEVADLAIGLLIATVRRIPQGDRFVREGRWLKGPMALTGSLQDKRLGVIGMGRIGRAIARRAEAFGLQVSYQGPNPKSDLAWRHYSDPVELARDSDIVIAACPGGAATRGLVNRAVIEAIGPQGVFVNISRGSVVDEPALIEALQSGRLGSAGLDVFADEPRVAQELLAMENVVLQPHVGSATERTRRAMGQLVVDNLAAHFAGKALLTPV